MFGKHVKLITMVMLVTALATGSATSMAQSLDGNDVTVDPGSADAQDRLIKEALPLISEGHFEPANLDFASSITSPSNKALFLPAKKSSWNENLIGLLYVDEVIYVQDHRFIPGLYSIKESNDQDDDPLSTQETSLISLDDHQQTCVGIGVSFIIDISTQYCYEFQHGDPGADDGAKEPENEGNCGEDGWAGGCPA